MARRAGPWYRSSHSMWYATVGGVQVSLGIRERERESEAWAAYAVLVNSLGNSPNPPLQISLPTFQPQPQPGISPARARTVAVTVEEFLAKRKPKIGADCWRQYDIALRVHFVAKFGDRPLSSLTKDEIEDWADRPEWSSSTRYGRLGTVMTFLKWAKHPLDIDRPPMESRGAESVLSEEQFAAVVKAASSGDYGSDLVGFLKVLRETGSRPQETARLTVENTDWGNSCHRTKLHKNKRHGGERIVYFNTAAMEILTAQREKYTTGHLFRTCRGNPWKCSAIVKRMAQVSKRAGIHATAYMGRHTFATAALVSGIPDAVVAELLGHSGTAMVAKHYSHLSGQSRVLREAVEKLCRPNQN